jgi:hypothetical protein
VAKKPVMELTLKLAALVLGPLFTLLLGLVVSRPRVCIRVALFIACAALGCLFSTLLTAYGTFLAKKAILAQDLGDTNLMEQVARATDKPFENMLVTAVVGGLALALCLAAVAVSRMVLEDKARDEASGKSAGKGEER